VFLNIGGVYEGESEFFEYGVIWRQCLFFIYVGE